MARRGDVNLSITGDSRDWNRELNRAERSTNRFTKKTQSMFGRVGKGIGKSLAGFGKSFMAPLAALAGGAAIIGAGRRIIDFDDNLLTLGLNAGLTKKEMFELREEIVDTAFASRRSRDDILGSISDIVDKTGDFDFARDSILGVGKAATAMGADINDVGRLASAASINLNLAGDDVEEFFNIIATQGNKGSFIFKDLASQAERLMSAAGRIGIVKDNFAEFGAFLQLARPSFGSAEETSTAIRNIATRLKTQRKQVEKLVGYSVFDDKGNIKDFRKTIVDLVKASEGDIKPLFDIFQEASLAFGTMQKEYLEFGELRSFDNLIAQASEGNFMLNAFEERTKNAKAQLQQLSNVAWEFADAGIAPVIAEMNKELSRLTSNPAEMEKFRKNLTDIGKAIGDMAALGVDIVHLVEALFSIPDIIGKVFDSVPHFIKDGAQNRKQIRDYGRASPKQRASIEEFNKQSIAAAAAAAQNQTIANDNKVEVTINQKIDREGKAVTTGQSSGGSFALNVKDSWNLPRGSIE